MRGEQLTLCSHFAIFCSITSLNSGRAVLLLSLITSVPSDARFEAAIVEDARDATTNEQAEAAASSVSLRAEATDSNASCTEPDNSRASDWASATSRCKIISNHLLNGSTARASCSSAISATPSRFCSTTWRSCSSFRSKFRSRHKTVLRCLFCLFTCVDQR